MSEIGHTLRAVPALLRAGAVEALAYRAEFVVWMLTNTMPLVMLGLWTSVAHDGPFAGYRQEDFVAYYLAALIVRTVTGSWVVWQINEEVREGTLSMKLLRPIHPLVAYAATHLSAVPLRSLVGLPLAVLLLVSSGRSATTTDPVLLGLLIPAIAGAWALTYSIMVLFGSLSFWVEKSLAIFDLYLGVSAVMSGYLLPLALLPPWLRAVANVLPFRFTLGYPVELWIGAYDRGEAVIQLAYQWLWVLAVTAAAVAVWRRGVRRYEAYGA
jgi:ABC-2 type transport system permease protein